jgi:hypothetical protein
LYDEAVSVPAKVVIAAYIMIAFTVAIMPKNPTKQASTDVPVTSRTAFEMAVLAFI